MMDFDLGTFQFTDFLKYNMYHSLILFQHLYHTVRMYYSTVKLLKVCFSLALQYKSHTYIMHTLYNRIWSPDSAYDIEV
jgi:hypothetical protein